MSFCNSNINKSNTINSIQIEEHTQSIREINDTNDTIKPEISEEFMQEKAIKKTSYMVEWYKKNKEKHINTLKTKSKCDCGVDVAYGNRLRHLETLKHKSKMELINLQNQIKN